MKTTEQMNSELLKKFPFLEIISEYTGANNKVRIRCNDCGYEWDAVARSTKNSKRGCPKCKVQESKKDSSKQHFLNNYNKDLYKFIDFKNYLNVTVQCKKCGYLRTTSSSNIYRYGCPKCEQEAIHDKQRMSKEEFIIKASLIHNNKYTYNKVDYINYNTPVIITCPIHGDFAQTPGKHLQGSNGIAQGCPKCVGKYKTTEEIIESFKEIHGDKYDYSKVNFVNKYTPVTIICKKHGEFKQLPGVHRNLKCGCPICKSSHGEELVFNILTKLGIEFNAQLKIDNPYKENRYFKVDFYLPLYNTIIEYNGKQHYLPVERFGGELAFVEQVNRDEDLRKYCNQFNINLLEIKYTDSDIEKIIKDFIKLPPE